MAAIDPSAEPEFAGSVIDGTTPRATLKIVRQPLDEEDEDDSDYDEDDEDNLRELLGLGSDDEDDDDEDESSEEEANGGPSDPSKSKKAKQAAMLQKLKAALEEEGSDEDMDDAPNGVAVKNNKGKAPATGEESDSDDEESIDLEMEEFVLCTLDPAQHYQQPLDIVVGENEKVFFKVTGTHAIFLTGNYVIPVDDSPRGDDERDMMYPEDDEEDYDLSPDEDELDMDGESDDLDDIDDPRITELGTDDDEQVPQLVKKEKGSKKRAAPESDDEPTLDSVMDKALKPAAEEPKLSKKQMKKLKNNAGEAIKSDTKVDTESPSSKKVQFAKNLEQGPTGSKLDTTAKTNGEKADKAADKPKSALGVKTVKGVTVDDKKLGSGPAAKKGNKVSMRYIGKLTDGKVFDCKLTHES
jgi:FK506-binding nuclear protein